MAAKSNLSPFVMEAIHAGQKIEAIKRLRKERGLGLKEAKQIIEHEMLYGDRGHYETMATESQISPFVMEAIQAGQKIEALRRIREERGLGLKAAKQIVEREMLTYHGVDFSTQIKWGPTKWAILFLIGVATVAICYLLAQAN